MGCASSSPLVESGKQLVDSAKDSAEDVLHKGEQTIQDVGDKISTEMGHVKEAVQSAMATAGNSIGSVIGNNVNAAQEAVDDLEEEADEALHVASDAGAEAVSEAETVLASEAESAKETADEVFHKMDAAVDEVQHSAAEVLQIEDMDDHVLGDSVSNVESKVEEIVARLPTPAPSPLKDPKKEEPPPTFWEAAADAILQQRSFSKSMDISDKEAVLTNHLILELNADGTPGDALEDANHHQVAENEVLVNSGVTSVNLENVYLSEKNN